MPIKHIVSVDPGDVNNGFCYFKYDTETKTADLRLKTILTGEGMSSVLMTLYEVNRDRRPDDDVDKPQKNPSGFYFVVENFRVDTQVRGGRNNAAMFQWKEMLTSEMIGRVKLCAEWLGAPVFMQEPAILGQGRKYSLFPVNKGHIQDDVSAFIHGAHFMISRNLIRTTDQITLFGQEKL